jgi:hypothetical protein
MIMRAFACNAPRGIGEVDRIITLMMEAVSTTET